MNDQLNLAINFAIIAFFISTGMALLLVGDASIMQLKLFQMTVNAESLNQESLDYVQGELFTNYLFIVGGIAMALGGLIILLIMIFRNR